MSRRTGSLAAALLLGASSAAARAVDDGDLSARVDADQVALDGTLTLQITATVSSKGDSLELQLPAFRDFDVVSRSQSEQVSFEFANGSPSFRRTTVTTLQLTPHALGSATIEPVKTTYRGRSYQTQPISVRVVPVGQGPRGSGRAPPPPPSPPFASGDEDPFNDVHPGSRDLLLRASVDRDRPYVGEQVTYSLHLLARVNVSGIDKLQLPKLDGFWSEEIESPQQLVGESRIIDGVPYRSFLLRRRALFALRPGRIEIEPAEVEVLTGFGMLFSRSSARRASQAITVDAQPLPAEGRPPGFDAGNVGSWTLSASVEPLAATVGQPVTFRLVAQGRGNVRDLQLPKLAPIDGMRAYDATTTDKESIEDRQVVGTRTVEQLLVPQRTGEIVLPALAMDVFDPAQKQYRTTRTEPIRVLVAAGAPTPASAAAAPQNVLAAGGVRPIRLRLTMRSPSAAPWDEAWFWPALGAGPLAFAVALLSRRAQTLFASDPGERRMKRARRAARARLRGAEALLEGARRGAQATGEFHAEVARALTGYLADKQGIVAAGLTRDELSRALAGRGHPPSTVRALVQILDECDRARFSPDASDVSAQEALLDRADRVLAELDKERRQAA
jgi:hypothetical protein